VTLTVPPGVLPAVLHELSMLGQEKSRSESTQNVTGEVIDVDTRVSNLTKMIDALEQLYDPTHRKLSELVDLEQQISDRESELESLQAQQRALRAQTDTATVTLTVQTKAAPHRHVGGFLGGLRHGWHAFLRGADALAIALGAVLPFALLASVVAIAARALWPWLGRRNVTPAAPE
jgi:chromosome segregation ATPase